MAIRRCDKGEHTFDDTLHSSCPYCRKTRLTTAPGAHSDGSVPPPIVPPPMNARTTPAPGVGGGGSGRREDRSKTRVIIGGGSDGAEADFGEIMPVVAWLVVINGKGLGKDLRIVPGMNHIGRDKGEILLNFGDESISREKHARLAYDSEESLFLLAHLEGRNLTKVNGKTVMDTYELQAYDQITMGQTQMVFVPLCGQDFSWTPTEE